MFNQELGGGTYVTVPDVSMRSVSDAARLLSQSGLELGQQKGMPDNRVPTGYVILQRPAGGKVVRSGQKVALTISAGTESLSPPNLLGKDLQKAIEELRLGTLSTGTVARIPNPAPRDTVLAQDPPATQLVATMAQINLLVSEGVQTANYMMPDLYMKPVQEALTLLAQYKVKAIPNPVNMPDAPPDVVLNQNPAAGTLLHEGDQVVYDLRPSSVIAQTKVTPDPYVVPKSWFDRELRIDTIDRNGVRATIYPQAGDYIDGAPPKVPSGSTVKLPTIEFTYKMTIEIFLDGQPARSIVYEGEAKPVVTDYPIQ